MNMIEANYCGFAVEMQALSLLDVFADKEDDA